MYEKKEILKRASLALVVLALGVVLLGVVKTVGQEGTNSSDRVPAEQWEYLAVAGPSTTNFTPTGNPRMRKEPNVPFGREAFVLEQHLDKLGANGWELVAVAAHQPTLLTISSGGNSIKSRKTLKMVFPWPRVKTLIAVEVRTVTR